MVRTAARRTALIGGALLWAHGARAQSIAGRVTDADGRVMAHVHVMARPVDDASDSAVRAAVTNDRGEFRILVKGGRDYDVTLRRIGYGAEATRPAHVPEDGEIRVDVSLTAIPLSLTTVQVTAPRCLPLDAPGQSDDVRAWVRSAEDMMRARRAVERDYEYTVHQTEVTGGHDVRGPIERHDSKWVQRVGATRRTLADEGWGMRAAYSSAGTVRQEFPTEARLLSPSFLALLCFDNVVADNPDRSRTIRFAQIKSDTGQHANDVAITGRFTLDSASGMYSEMTYEFKPDRRLIDVSGTLKYETVMIDGEAFPMLRSRAEHEYFGRAARNARPPESRHIEYDYTFSDFVRRPPQELTQRRW